MTDALRVNWPALVKSGLSDVTRLLLLARGSVAETSTLTDALRVNWPALAKSGLSDVTFERLLLLASKQEGWRGEGSRALRGASIAKFLRFWAIVRGFAREPELMLTPTGMLQAEWFKTYRQFLEVAFHDGENDSLSFGIVDRSHRLEGIVSQDQLVTILREYRDGKVLQWGALPNLPAQT